MDEFKEFLKTIPSIKQDVLNGRYTWQQLYEIFVMYGKDDKFWQPYKTGNNFDLNMLVEVIKNIDLNALSNSLNSIEKVLNVVNTFLDKKEPEKENKLFKPANIDAVNTMEIKIIIMFIIFKFSNFSVTLLPLDKKR